MLADVLPTGYEVGVLNGKVQPGDTVAVVGTGPVGLSAITGAKMYSPAHIVAIDLADARLEAAKGFGADVTVNNSREDAVAYVKGLTGSLGVDVAIEEVGVLESFELCTQLVRPGSHAANIGVHGKPATLYLESLWIRDLTITTGLVDTYSTPTLLRLVSSRQVDAERFISRHFELGQMYRGVRRLRPGFRDRCAEGRPHLLRRVVGPAADDGDACARGRAHDRTSAGLLPGEPRHAHPLHCVVGCTAGEAMWTAPIEAVIALTA